MSMCFSCAVGACNAERFGIREWWLKIGLRSVGGTQNSSCSSLPPQPPRHPPHPPHPRSPLQPPPPPPWRWEALRACRSAGRAISFFCISLLPFGLGAERLLILNIIQSLQTVCLVPSLGCPTSVVRALRFRQRTSAAVLKMGTLGKDGSTPLLFDGRPESWSLFKKALHQLHDKEGYGWVLEGGDVFCAMLQAASTKAAKRTVTSGKGTVSTNVADYQKKDLQAAITNASVTTSVLLELIANSKTVLWACRPREDGHGGGRADAGACSS
jgi:hypothetical protein